MFDDPEGRGFLYIENPKEVRQALFSNLLFRRALPLLLIAPTVLYGTLTAFFEYHDDATGSLMVSAARGANNLTQNLTHTQQLYRQSVVELLYRETFGAFYPPYRWRLPELALLFSFDPEAWLATLQSIPELIRGALLALAARISALNFDPLYFLEGSRAMLTLNLLVAILKPLTAVLSKVFSVAMSMRFCLGEEENSKDKGPYKFADIAKKLTPNLMKLYARGNIIRSIAKFLYGCCVQSERDAWWGEYRTDCCEAVARKQLLSCLLCTELLANGPSMASGARSKVNPKSASTKRAEDEELLRAEERRKMRERIETFRVGRLKYLHEQQEVLQKKYVDLKKMFPINDLYQRRVDMKATKEAIDFNSGEMGKLAVGYSSTFEDPEQLHKEVANIEAFEKKMQGWRRKQEEQRREEEEARAHQPLMRVEQI